MTKTDKYRNGVISVTGLARTVNPEIGSYIEHYINLINEGFGFSVKLSNGAINMSIEVAQDYEAQPISVTPERIEKVAATFRKI
jgi:hypothetical protein